jgi:peptidoglycan pentaglycine glycine transferase (the first glycine)
MPEVTASEWNAFLEGHSAVHLLQTAAWGDFKAAFGWEVARQVEDNCGAQVLFKRLPLGFSFGYIPKGPVGGIEASLWQAIDKLCQKHRAAFLKVEPDLWQDLVTESSGDLPQGFQIGTHTVQPLRTILVDLCGEEEELLARMKQKTRYNIRLAQKKGVVVHPSSQVDRFYELMTTTGARDGFGVHSQAYFQQAYDIFQPLGMGELLLAEFEGQLLAGLMVFQHQGRAWYLYGASSDVHRNLMPSYLLQWEAMLWARQKGCTSYDLWGVPDEPEALLEEQFPSRSEGLWGVYRFKRGFGGQLRRAAGPWDRVYHSLLYSLYRMWAGRDG